MSNKPKPSEPSETPHEPQPEPQCWQKMGVWGDSSCEALRTHIHCRNCPVYQGAGRQLLDREASETYTQNLSEQFNPAQQAEQTEYPEHQALSLLLIFRLQNEWLAIDSQFFREAAPPTPCHTIPHRSNRILKGLLSIRGEMMLCVSLSHLLGLDEAKEEAATAAQMLVMELENETWIFPVDAFEGLQAVPEHLLLPPPATVTQGDRTYTQSVFSWKGHQVNLLDGELLFYAIQRQAVP